MGSASETFGRISVTMVLKTVRANKTVTPEKMKAGYGGRSILEEEEEEEPGICIIQSKYSQFKQMAVVVIINKVLLRHKPCQLGPPRPTTLPSSGICSDVMGIFSEILSWNTVSDSRTVTPVMYNTGKQNT